MPEIIRRVAGPNVGLPLRHQLRMLTDMELLRFIRTCRVLYGPDSSQMQEVENEINQRGLRDR